MFEHLLSMKLYSIQKCLPISAAVSKRWHTQTPMGRNGLPQAYMARSRDTGPGTPGIPTLSLSWGQETQRGEGVFT